MKFFGYIRNAVRSVISECVLGSTVPKEVGRKIFLDINAVNEEVTSSKPSHITIEFYTPDENSHGIDWTKPVVVELKNE